jgi:hypothetical protein
VGASLFIKAEGMKAMTELKKLAWGVILYAASGNFAASAGPITYWNVFNIEQETAQNAQFVTYSSLNDMLLDANRTGVFTPIATSPFAARNIVGSGSDGQSYWNVFNIEQETAQNAQLVTYSSLNDMLLDANRTGVFTPTATSPFAARNIVGTGASVAMSVAEPGVIWILVSGLIILLIVTRRSSPIAA